MPGRRTSTMELLAREATARGMPTAAAEDVDTAPEPAPDPAAGAAPDPATGAAPDRAAGAAPEPAYWYGGPVAGARLAGRLGYALLEPADDWLAELPEEFTGREVRAATVADAWALDRPTFVKPPREKSFPADVYADGSRLPSGLDPSTPVLLSDVVTFAAEYRLFLLDGRIATASRYAVFGRLDPCPLDGHGTLAAEIAEFVHRLVTAAGPTLPSAVVVDVGRLLDPYRAGHRWAVVEANMAWFSHAYAADPARVLDVVLRAAGPRDRVRPEDLRFVRH